MRRPLAALSLALLLAPGLAACTSSGNRSGDANTDSQVQQPVLPSDDPNAGGVSQGPSSSPTR